MRLALAQYELESDMERNLAKVLALTSEAASNGAGLILFPELCLSPFFPQYPGQEVTQYALSIEDGPIRKLQRACQESGLLASPNVYLREGGLLFDASLMLEADGALLGLSKMVHIAQLPGFYEQDYYAPSDTGFPIYNTSQGKIGIVVCFDRHFPESIRTCAMHGAALVLIPTANTLAEPRDVFECELRAAAFQNGVYIAMCNRVGREGDTVFCGESIVIDPEGNVVTKADACERLVTAEVDLSTVALARAKRPYLSLRRPESYG